MNQDHTPPLPEETHRSSSTPESSKILEKESLGEYFRKVRISNRIDLARMAKETCISLEYLQAIEKNEFERLPGDTYRKIFVKNVAKYLELDPEESFARFLRETQPQVTEETNSKAKESLGEQPPSPITRRETRSSQALAQPKSVRPILVALFIILVVLIVLLSQNTGNSKEPVPESAMPIDTPAVLAATTSTDSLKQDTLSADSLALPPKDSINQTQIDTLPKHDSLKPAAPAPIETTKVTPKSTAEQIKSSRFLPENDGAIKVMVICIRDSAEVSAWRNGKSWFNRFLAQDAKTFAGDTAIYFRIGYPRKTRLKMGDQEYEPAPPKGKPVIRVDANGITYHTVKEWEHLKKR